ncbi:BolA family transcriptional regulator [Aureimonas endophytica]|uniref:BolA family transcriptional regulator n=1 Tax=Aureimonas endophytica TaxID=2027858 RepID=A0A916ZTN9_9HYPH|nr:BolA family transcriptional regulator [Aureimonas endophytica]GGE13389.1 BolA family transcriptional regulator [Aureimonas endophytica]
MSRHSRESIEARLRAAFAPESLAVIDESHLHAGHHHGGSDHHAGFDGSGGTHFRVRIVAPGFAGLGRLARHRAVNEALREELASGVHALAIEASAPGEPTRR